MSSSGFCTSETCDHQFPDGDEHQLVSLAQVAVAQRPRQPVPELLCPRRSEHISEILRDSELVFRALHWLEIWLEVFSDHKEAKNFRKLGPRIWF